MVSPKFGILRTGIFERAYLKETVTISDYKTFYTRFGDIFAYLCTIITALFLLKAGLKRKS